ncbi:tyrosine-protein kinase [Dyadobacter sp. NIV53]|uniref:GumC family protein n=1 Tax=Dyadobacter sp. NIV53 TaxID=2861765 RepID=UPI001C8714CA|nr:tyrosine-protein kinase [Dyadobacter sp. NIV53]
MNKANQSRDQQSNAEDEDFDLTEYIRKYFRYWYLFPLFVIISLTAAYFYLQITQPVYLSRTTILIKDEKKGIGQNQSDILQEMAMFGGNKLVENETEILKSQPLMEQVIKNLKLDVSYSTIDGIKTVDLYKKSPVIVKPAIITEEGIAEPMTIHVTDANHFTINSEGKPFAFNQRFQNKWGEFTVLKGEKSDYKDIIIHFSNPASLVEGMIDGLAVLQPNVKSTVLQLTYADVSKQRGMDILNTLLDAYIQASLTDKNTEASNTLKFIETRLGLITGELGDVEKDVETYKTSKGLTDISAESQIFLENIQENDARLNEINTKIKVLESVYNFIENAGEGAPAPATYMIDDPVLVSLLTKFNELDLQRERYARTTQAGNPLLETITTQLAQTRQAIKDNVQNLRRGMDVTKQNLEGINTRFSAGLRTIPQKEREYVGIKRQQTIKENLYLYLLQKREETALGYASTVTDSRLINPPVSSFAPIAPKRSVVWGGAGAAGIIIPILLINLIFLLNNTVQSREEIEKQSGLPVIGEIGLMKYKDGIETESIITMTSRSAVAEQFRAMRTNLMYLGNGSCRTLMFTSSVGGEGKSFVSINLAASLAYYGKKVILVGLDLRKPTLHDRLQVSNRMGVSNYMVGQTDLHELIQPTGIHPQFDVITAGPLPPNPSELIGNGRLPELLAELRLQYDYILIDSPPYGLVTDSSLIAECVDATLYVVRYNYTLLGHLKKIADLRKSKRFNNLTVIYNGVNYGAGYGYGYGYGGYGYGYYTEDDKSKPKDIGSKIKKLVGKS